MSRKKLLAVALALVVITVGAIGCTEGFTFPEGQQA